MARYGTTGLFLALLTLRFFVLRLLDGCFFLFLADCILSSDIFVEEYGFFELPCAIAEKER